MKSASGSTGGSRRRRARNAPMGEINVTPFVDVMLVLLIVFMVAAPMMAVGVPVQLPRTAAGPIDSERQDPITINVDAAGEIFLQGEPVSREALPEQLALIVQERGEQERIFMRADQGAAYGDVMVVMGELNSKGLRNIGLVTDSSTGGGGARSAAAAATAGSQP